MTIEEVKAFLSENKDSEDVKKLIVELSPGPTADQMNKYLDSDEGFREMRPRFDRYAQKAITTHDEKRAPEVERLLQEAVDKAKSDGKLTAQERVQKELDELKMQISAGKSELARRDLISDIRAEAEKLNVPVDLAIDLENPSLTRERATERLEAYAKEHAAKIQDEVNKRLAGSYKPGSGTGESGTTDISKMSFEEIVKLEEAGTLNAAIAQ